MFKPNICYIYYNEEYKPIAIPDVINLKYNTMLGIPYLIIKREYNCKIEDVHIDLNKVKYFCIEYK